LIGEDIVNGPLAMQPEMAVDILFKKYIRNRYVYGDLFRDVRFEYSNRALREAVLNACIHKDYLKGNPVFIKVRPDRIEIFNEGSLPESWTYEDFVSEDHNSLPPNKKIASVFHKMGLIEHWGRGIRLMIEECRKDGSKLPEFTVDKHGVTVKFFSMLGPDESVVQADNELTDFERKVFDAVSIGTMAKVRDIVEVTGISLGSVSRALSSLKEKGLIIRTGTNRNGLWVVVGKIDH
jgi:ATP-dependent DNA helicase RecG